MNRFLTSFILLIVPVLSACTTRVTPGAQPTGLPATKAAPVVTSAPLPANTAAAPTTDPGRYFNPSGGFSLQLPEGWSVTGPVTVNNDPNRPFEVFALGIDPQLEGGPGRSLIAILDTAQWDVAQFVQSQCSTCPANPIEQITLAGKPAQRTQIGGGGVPFTTTWTFIENNGKLIALAIHDPETLEPFLDVIESIQFE